MKKMDIIIQSNNNKDIKFVNIIKILAQDNHTCYRLHQNICQKLDLIAVISIILTGIIMGIQIYVWLHTEDVTSGNWFICISAISMILISDILFLRAYRVKDIYTIPTANELIDRYIISALDMYSKDTILSNCIFISYIKKRIDKEIVDKKRRLTVYAMRILFFGTGMMIISVISNCYGVD
jgi:hypothetical protein